MQGIGYKRPQPPTLRKQLIDDYAALPPSSLRKRKRFLYVHPHDPPPQLKQNNPVHTTLAGQLISQKYFFPVEMCNTYAQLR